VLLEAENFLVGASFLGSGTAKIALGPLVSYGPFKAALRSLTLYLAAFLGKRGSP
jgi:hypothetical protein